MIETEEQYQEAREKLERMIQDAMEQGLLEPELQDNDLVREIGLVAKEMSEYEKKNIFNGTLKF